MKFSNIHTIHLVGIGGIGMSGIAEILLNQGFNVSGSDMTDSDGISHLKEIGAEITIGHNKENVNKCDILVYSSAISADNVEIIAAAKAGIPTIRRAEMLAELTRLHYCIAVAGTHGKTTTTSLLGLMLIEAGIDPTVIVGGKLHAFGGTNARLGKGEFMVVEADEYDRSFLQLNPSIAVLTSLEEEHMDIYTDIDDLMKAFEDFSNKVPFYGFVSLCLDDPILNDIRPNISRKVITFGLSSKADYQATKVEYQGCVTQFTLNVYGKESAIITLQIPGEHNIINTLAAISVAHQIGVSVKDIEKGVREFTGAFRRFDIQGVVNGVTVIDDYAHHPTEVRETLKAIRNGWSNRVVCVFQPHTYTRTKVFCQEYAKVFMNTDVLIVMPIYAAREKPIQGVTGKMIVEAAVTYGHRQAVNCEDQDFIPKLVHKYARIGDIVIFMGAGDIYKLIPKTMKLLEKGDHS